jgi:hypothetical protein
LATSQTTGKQILSDLTSSIRDEHASPDVNKPPPVNMTGTGAFAMNVSVLIVDHTGPREQTGKKHGSTIRR